MYDSSPHHLQTKREHLRESLLHPLEKTCQLCWLAALHPQRCKTYLPPPSTLESANINCLCAQNKLGADRPGEKHCGAKDTMIDLWILTQLWVSIFLSSPVLLLLLWWISDSSSVSATLHFYTLAFTATFVIQGKRFYFFLTYLRGNTKEVASSMVYMGANFV